MKTDTLALLNARTGPVKFKYALAADAMAFGLYLYLGLSAGWHFLLLAAVVLWLVRNQYSNAKRQLSE